MERFSLLKNEITNYSYKAEQRIYEEASGRYLSHNELISLLINREAPKDDQYYKLNGMEVLQTVDHGILANIDEDYYGIGVETQTIFIYTDRDFIDKARLNGFYGYQDGTYRYESVLGLKNIRAFRLVNLDFKDNKYKGRKYYFFPGDELGTYGKDVIDYSDTILKNAAENIDFIMAVPRNRIKIKLMDYNIDNETLPIELSLVTGSGLVKQIFKICMYVPSDELNNMIKMIHNKTVWPILGINKNFKLIYAQFYNDKTKKLIDTHELTYVPPDIVQRRAAEIQRKKLELLAEKQREKSEQLAKKEREDEEKQHRETLARTGFDYQELTVTDTKTGLMWTRSPSPDRDNWNNAALYAKNKQYAGFNDWRLPTTDELYSLLEHNKTNDYYLSSVGFYDVKQGLYWSSPMNKLKNIFHHIANWGSFVSNDEMACAVEYKHKIPGINFDNIHKTCSVSVNTPAYIWLVRDTK